jgi:hypothetical protein
VHTHTRGKRALALVAARTHSRAPCCAAQVDHIGLSGWTASQMRASLSHADAADGAPSYHEDVTQRRWRTLPSALAAATAAGRGALNGMLSALARDDSGGRTRTSFVDAAAALPHLSGASQAERDARWEPDGLHLSPSGYDELADAVFAVLRRDAGETLTLSGGDDDDDASVACVAAGVALEERQQQRTL